MYIFSHVRNRIQNLTICTLCTFTFLCTLQLNYSYTLLYMYIFCVHYYSITLIHFCTCTLQSNDSNTVLYIGWYRPCYVHSANSSNKTTVAVNMNNHSISLNMCCRIITYKLHVLLFWKASLTILADFCPEFSPPFRWRSKHQTKNDCSYQ